MLYKNLTFLSVLDSTDMLVKQRHSSTQEQAGEAEKQGFHPHDHVKKAASLPQLAHRIHYSEKAVQGVTGTAKVSSRFPLFGSRETNIKFHLKLKCNSSIPQHCKMTSSAAGPSNQLTCKA